MNRVARDQFECERLLGLVADNGAAPIELILVSRAGSGMDEIHKDPSNGRFVGSDVSALVKRTAFNVNSSNAVGVAARIELVSALAAGAWSFVQSHVPKTLGFRIGHGRY